MRTELRYGTSRWSIAACVIGLLLFLPLAIVLTGAVVLPAPNWSHVLENLLGGYAVNTLVLVVLTGGLTLAFALPAAWLVSAYRFPLRNFFSWALVLPLAIPTYVAAYAYSDLLEHLLPIQIWARKQIGIDASLAADWIFRRGILSLVLASVLAPYVYLSARASFSLQARSSIEAAQTLGCSMRRVFWRIALPMARPAIAAGLALVVMEVLNDYGAVLFFGVPTLTVGVFRTWHGLEDAASALRIAAIVLAVVLGLLALERQTRGRARFEEAGNRYSPAPQRQLTGAKALLALLLCGIPLLLGFLVPAGRLLLWARTTVGKVMTPEFLVLSLKATGLALTAAVLVVATALILFYAARIHRTLLVKLALRLGTIGYAVPGVVVAVGVLFLLGWLDRGIGKAGAAAGHEVGMIFGGTLFALGFAYLVRFLAVARGPIAAGMGRLHGNLDEASRTLGHSPSSTLGKVVLPLMRGPLLAATMLLFVDLLKELPITLLLRPFNFETLATKTFSLAQEGRIPECAVPSLVLILAGALGLVFLNRLLEKRPRGPRAQRRPPSSQA